MASARSLTSTNQFLNGSQELSGFYAGKSGYSPDAGATLVSAVQQENRELLVVVLGCETGKSYEDTAFLVHYLTEDAEPVSLYGGCVTGIYSEGFSVSAVSSYAIKKGMVAYWTVEGGQDDIVWAEAALQDGMLSALLPAENGLYQVVIEGRDAQDVTLSRESFFVLMTGRQLSAGFQEWDGRLWMILPNGGCSQGWFENNINQCYSNENGLWKEGILALNGVYYYFKDYQLQRGWLSVGGNTYYGLASGELATGAMMIDGIWRNFDGDGRLLGLD